MRKNLTIIYQLIRADLTAFKGIALDETIDLLIWVSVITIIDGYILPLFQVPKEFILLSFTGTVASGVSFRAFPNIYGLVADLHGERKISQKLTLPIPSWLVFVAMTCSFFLTAIFVCAFVLPCGMLIMWQIFPTTEICVWRFLLIFMSSALFFGAFSIFIASQIKGIDKTGRAFIRIIFPLWFFGGFNYTWQKLYDASPFLGMINLLNPYIYVMEGTRAALLGPSGNLPTLYCIGALCLFTLIALWLGINNFKKQLDFV